MPVDRLASRKHQRCSLVESLLRQSLIRSLFSSHPARTEVRSVSIQLIGPIGSFSEILSPRQLDSELRIFDVSTSQANRSLRKRGTSSESSLPSGRDSSG